MLSRVGDSTYWMGRYIERAENNARLLDVNVQMLLDFESRGVETERQFWGPILSTLEDTELFDELHGEFTASALLDYVTFEPRNPNSISSCINYARENARAVRDQISEEMWLELNALWLDLKQIPESDPESHGRICEAAVRSSLLFRGIVNTSLPRTDVWAFVQLGEYIERADKTSRIVDLPHFLPAHEAAPAWNTMLRACSATAEYRHRFGGEVDATNASLLLLFSTTFPRSVRFCVRRMDELLHQISDTDEGEYLNEAERATGALLARLNFSGVEEIGTMGLHEYVDSLQTDLNRIGYEILQRYFLLRRDAPPASAEDYVNSRMQAQVSMQQ